ncbi:MAG: hypothetical protein ACOH5I_07830 [Oligoflexus sp.]
MKKILLPLLITVALAIIAILWARSGSAPTSDQLISDYPNIAELSERQENKKILCPFLRIIERAGLLDTYKSTENLAVGITSLVKAAQTLGCGMIECGGVALKVSKGQQETLDQDLGIISLEKLHLAEGIAHDCGFTFAKGGEEVSDEVREQTLLRIASMANDQGHVGFDALLTTKNEICADQNVEISEAGLIEVKLIFAYLGGMDRGFIYLDDIRRLFHAEMPINKTSRWIRLDLFKEMTEAYGLE